jgi:CheY-like chemotaxis protein
VVKIDPKIKIDKVLNGQEAIDNIIADIKSNDYLKCSYNLILMDCNMPFVDGYEATT